LSRDGKKTHTLALLLLPAAAAAAAPAAQRRQGGRGVCSGGLGEVAGVAEVAEEVAEEEEEEEEEEEILDWAGRRWKSTSSGRRGEETPHAELVAEVGEGRAGNVGGGRLW
jgi:hypothetical protein